MWPFNKRKTHVIRSRPVARTRSFYAGVVDRLTNTFKGNHMSINESLKKDLDKMRARSRTLVNDNDYGKKFVNMVKTNIVGPKGVKLQSKGLDNAGKPDKLDNDAIENTWIDWGKKENCTVNHQLSFLDVETVAVAAVATDGEAIIRIVRGDRYKYGIALQMIASERLDTTLNQEAANGKNLIVMGIEFNKFDEPVNYHILTSIPGDGSIRIAEKQYMIIPAKDIIHLFKPERVGQARGIPWMHTSIRRLDMIGGYEEAELVAARSGASKGGHYYTETGEEYKGDDVTDDGQLIEEIEPGVIRQLPTGVKFEAYDPQHPTGAYNYFMTGVLKGAAAGLGVSYTGLTGDLTAVNYSSIRTGLVEERDNWRTDQRWFIDHFMNEVYKQWLSAALTRGLIVNDGGVTLPLSRKDKYLTVKWQPRGWAWVDPLKDQQANRLAVDAGHKTNTDVVSAYGGDLEDIYEQLAYEQELAKSYKLDFNGVNKDANKNGKTGKA